jgi:hypothetical protein
MLAHGIGTGHGYATVALVDTGERPAMIGAGLSAPIIITSASP